MNKIFKKLVGLLLISSVFLLAGCIQQGPNDLGENQPAPRIFQEVTQEEFTAAVKKLRHSVDEFNGEEKFFYNVEYKNYSKSRGNRGTLVAEFKKSPGSSDWQFQFSGAYSGNEWIFFDTIDLKSTAMSANYKIDLGNNWRKVLGGGVVAEAGGVFLSDSQIRELQKYAWDKNGKFRLTGTDGIFTAKLTSRMRERMSNLITAYAGIKQGFTYPN